MNGERRKGIRVRQEKFQEMNYSQCKEGAKPKCNLKPDPEMNDKQVDFA